VAVDERPARTDGRRLPVPTPLNPIVQALVLAGVGFVSAVVNTLAGGGTLLTVPAMVLLGYEPLAANATNRLTIAVQGISASALYRRKRVLDVRLSLSLSAFAAAGSLAGAWLATILDEELFRRALAALLLVGALYLFRHRARWFVVRAGAGRKRPVLTHAGFLVLGVYGGFFGAGIGVFILLLLAGAQRLDLVAGNAIKSAVVLFLSLAAAAVFAYAGAIDWAAAIPLAVGNGIGGWVGAHLSLKGGNRWIRRVLLVVVVAGVYKLLV
jgi:uncharacterized membrane protein YfcA